MATAQRIIEKALRKIHVLGRGQPLVSEEANDALDALNDLLSSFSVECGTILNNTRETFSLTGAISYSIGVGADFNTSPPIQIISAFMTIGSIDYPITVINAQQYAAISTKNTLGTPELLYFEANNPIGRIFLNPVGVSGSTLSLWSKKAFTSFAGLTTDYDLGDGVESMLVHNLAVVIAPDYEKEASLTVQKEARRSKRAVETAVSRNSYSTSEIDVASSPGANGNIFSGFNI